MAKTGDRVLWRTLGEAYDQQWTAATDDDDNKMFAKLLLQKLQIFLDFDSRKKSPWQTQW